MLPRPIVRFKFLVIAAALFLAGCQSGRDVAALDGPGSSTLAYAAAEDPRYAGLVIEAASGAELYADHADELRYPASLTKMMTLYLLFEELDRGRFGMNTPLAVSAYAARQPASKLGVTAGSSIRVDEAILAIAVKSANDVATVVAENVSGSEAAFAERMTRTARSLGMRNTRFRNASGLPDPAQVTTARDMAVLVRALQRRFPHRFSAFSAESFSYGGRTYRSTNQLIGEVPGMDFGKTGYTRASGYNLVTSVQRGGRRIIVVVLGAPSGAARNAQVEQLVASHLPERGSWLAFGD
jgi:D-alanyl-D-alanine carboxypeptidase